MRSSRRLGAIVLSGLVLGLGSAGLAAAVASPSPAPSTLAFDDLGASPVGTHMQDGYGGFKWGSSDWHFMTSAVSSNTYLALSGTATSIVRTGGVDFTFQGADVWSRRGLDANGTFYFVLQHDGVLVYDGRKDPDGRKRFTGTATTFAPNYAGPVDVVAIVFAQGGGDWDHLALDNFRFTDAPSAPAPAPTTVTPTPAPAPAPTPAPGAAVTTYKVNVKTAGKGSVAISRTGTSFLPGTVITLTATPAAGATWTGWTGDVTSSSLSITIVVTASMTVQANFK